MLDQNTDRMWYVIGAVIVGAALIFLVNSSFPQLFASVGDTFSSKTDEITDVVSSIAEPEEWTVLKTMSEPAVYTHKGSVVNQTSGHSIPELGNVSAIRVKGSGGDTVIKGYIDVLYNRDQIKNRRYVHEVGIKNMGTTKIELYDNRGTRHVVNPGQSGTYIFKSLGSPELSHIQLQLRTVNMIDDSIDVLISPIVFGYYPEKGGF